MAASLDDGTEHLRLLVVDVGCLFVTSTGGRLGRMNSPDRPRAPRLFFAGCAGGNLLRLRLDVSAETARRALALAEREPPWVDPAATPACLRGFIDLLSAQAAAEPAGAALIYRLPSGLDFDVPASIVRSGTPQGEQLLSRLAADGMPPALAQAGFVGAGDFWEPWCVALVGDEIAAMAFAARIGEAGAEVGVYTFPGYRSRGLAAAVTAAWSRLPQLADRALFYSTLAKNLSSRRVAERLGLRRIGVSVSID
ncbi:MAG: GNAT family N-acetyltransferase [Caulobacterales bacterium]